MCSPAVGGYPWDSRRGPTGTGNICHGLSQGAEHRLFLAFCLLEQVRCLPAVLPAPRTPPHTPEPGSRDLPSHTGGFVRPGSAGDRAPLLPEPAAKSKAEIRQKPSPSQRAGEHRGCCPESDHWPDKPSILLWAATTRPQRCRGRRFPLPQMPAASHARHR